MPEDLIKLEELYKNGRFIDDVILKYRGFDKEYRNDIKVECIRLHNEKTIDLITLLNEGALQELSNHNYFSVMHFMCDLIPNLVEEPDRMMGFVSSLVKRAGDDLAANQPNAAFRLWCQKDSTRARRVVDSAKSGDKLSSNFLSFALESLRAIGEARKIVNNYNGICRLSAITALGRIEDNNIDSCGVTLKAFREVLRQGADDIVRCNLLDSTINIYIRGSDEIVDEIVTLIEAIVEDASDQTIHIAATSLWVIRNKPHPGVIHCLFKVLLNVSADNKGTIHQLDQGLESLFEGGCEGEVIEFVTELFVMEDNTLSLAEFSGFMGALLSGPQKYISRVVVEWLLNGDPDLCGGLDSALVGEGTDGPPLNINATDLPANPETQKFLCRKLVGWFFMRPTTVASLLVSVLKACDEGIAEEVRELLFDPLLLNYGGAQKYLKGCLEKDGENKYITIVLDKCEEYFRSINAIPVIKELRPSVGHRRIEALRKSDEARKIQKQAKEQSVFLNLVRQETLLYGDSSVSFIKDGDGKYQPMEMNLNSMSWEFEMPRMDVIDPVGLNGRIRLYRAERMKQ